MQREDRDKPAIIHPNQGAVLQLAGQRKMAAVPVILGSYVNAYSIVRAFDEVGIRSILAVWQDELGCCTRLADIKRVPDPVKDEEGFVGSLVRIGESLPEGGFLVCTDDATVLITAKYQDKLCENYTILGPQPDVLESCVDKRPMHAAAERAEVAVPLSFFCNGVQEIRATIDLLPYPCLIKPTITVGFKKLLGLPGKALTLPDKEAMEQFLLHLENVGLAEREYVLQKIIPGGAEQLYTLTAYCNTKSEIIAYSTGHKIRQHPPDAGTIISGRLARTDEILEPSARLVRELRFHGICNIEFKKDINTGEFKLIEINARPGMWNYSATASGINLPHIAYRDLLIEKLSPIPPSPQELVWVMTLDDLWHSVRDWRCTEYKRYALSVTQWLHSLRGKKVDPVFNLRDPGPWLYLLKEKMLAPLRNKMGKRGADGSGDGT